MNDRSLTTHRSKKERKEANIDNTGIYSQHTGAGGEEFSSTSFA
jgi:hypothetical protein